jgi:hypothetical protein
MDMSTGLGDFHDTVAVSHPNRVTEKLVIAQHRACLANLVRIRAQVEQFYLRQSALKAANRQDRCVAA